MEESLQPAISLRDGEGEIDAVIGRHPAIIPGSSEEVFEQRTAAGSHRKRYRKTREASSGVDAGHLSVYPAAKRNCVKASSVFYSGLHRFDGGC